MFSPENTRGSRSGLSATMACTAGASFCRLLDGGDLLVNRSARPPDERPVNVPRRVAVRSLRHLLSAIPWLASAKRRLTPGRRSYDPELTTSNPAGDTELDAFETYTDEFNETVASYAMSWPSRLALDHLDVEQLASAPAPELRVSARRAVGLSGNLSAARYSAAWRCGVDLPGSRREPAGCTQAAAALRHTCNGMGWSAARPAGR